MTLRQTVLTVTGAVVITATLSADTSNVRQTSPRPKELFDVVLANGRVVDPDTKPDAVRNVGIKDGRIAEPQKRFLASRREEGL